MLYNVVFHNVDRSSAFENFVNDKIDKLLHRMPRLRNLKFIVEKSSQRLNQFNFKMIGLLNGKEFVLHSEDKDLHLAANRVFSKLDNLRR